MPALIAIDWNEVKTLALVIGVREAARRMGISEEAAMKRSQREGWLEKRHAARAALSPDVREKTLAAAHGSDVRDVRITPKAVDILASLSQNSRTKLAIAGDKAATKLSELEGDELITPEVAATAKAWSGTLATTHGWQTKDSGERPGHVINVSLMCQTPMESHQDAPGSPIIEMGAMVECTSTPPADPMADPAF